MASLNSITHAIPHRTLLLRTVYLLSTNKKTIIDTHHVISYHFNVIKNILHKGLNKFYTHGSTAGILQDHQKRLRLILARLEVIHCPEDMNLPGFDFHKLTGTRKEEYAVRVNKNWRIVFKFNGKDVIDVDYLDYH